MVAYVQEEVLNGGRSLLVVVGDPIKSREQEQKYHAIIGEIADTDLLYGKKLSDESWKRLLIDAFKHATKDDPDLKEEWDKFGGMELLPALNHPGFVAVGEQSRKFSKKLASAFIEWLLAFQAGAERDRG
jgi:hypothetical protein